MSARSCTGVREKYVDLLLDELAASLHEPTAEQLEQELIVLGLLDYCREGLRRRMRRLIMTSPPKLNARSY